MWRIKVYVMCVACVWHGDKTMFWLTYAVPTMFRQHWNNFPSILFPRYFDLLSYYSVLSQVSNMTIFKLKNAASRNSRALEAYVIMIACAGTICSSTDSIRFIRHFYLMMDFFRAPNRHMVLCLLWFLFVPFRLLSTTKQYYIMINHLVKTV